MKEAKLLQLIEKVYDAADTPACWTDFLEQFSDLFHSESCALYVHDLSRCRSLFEHNRLPFVRHTRFDLQYTATVPYFNDGGFNVRPESSINIPEGAVFKSVYSDSDLINTVFSGLKPQGHASYGMDGEVLRRDSISVRLSATRAKWQGPFTDADVENCQQLMPHLQRVCNLYIKQAETQALRDCSLDNLSLLPVGVILLNQNGKALFCNRAAEKIIERNDGLSLDINGYCRNSAARETKVLQKWIKDSIETGVGQGREGMKLTRPGSAHPLWVQISPLSGQYLSLYEIPCAALFVYDADNNVKLSSTVLSNLYGLSPTEAKLAASLAMGSTLDEFAVTHDRSINTVRVQLKQVFSKTGTHSQTDLLRLILNGPVMLQRVIE